MSEHPQQRTPGARDQDLESWLLGLQPEDMPGMVEEFRALSKQKERLESDMQSALQRNAELELKLDALELDTQRVHRFLDEFEVPRHMQSEEPLDRSAGRAPSTDLSLLGRVELVLEDEDDEEEDEQA